MGTQIFSLPFIFYHILYNFHCHHIFLILPWSSNSLPKHDFFPSWLHKISSYVYNIMHYASEADIWKNNISVLRKKKNNGEKLAGNKHLCICLSGHPAYLVCPCIHSFTHYTQDLKVAMCNTLCQVLQERQRTLKWFRLSNHTWTALSVSLKTYLSPKQRVIVLQLVHIT